MLSRLCCCFSRGVASEKVSKVGSTHNHSPNGKEEAKAVDESKKAVPKSGRSSSQSAVLVELFTSQGCSSCPQADLLFSKLGRGDIVTDVPVVVLAYHVEYWDYLGWKDPFGSNQSSVRQRAYGQALQQDSIYTPEVIIQGRAHCIGSNAESVLSLIATAPRFPAPDIQSSFSRLSSSILEISLSANLKFKVEGCDLDIMAAIYENGLVTDCLKGENGGRVLTNDFVVKGLKKVCTVRDWSPKKPIMGQVSFNLWEGFSRAKCGMAVFFQNSSSLEVYGAQQLELPEDA